MDEPTFINRSAFWIRCRQPFVDWMNTLSNPPKDHPAWTLEDANAHPEVFLVREYDHDTDFMERFNRHKSGHFQRMMEGWARSESECHKDMSAAEFDKWFEVVWSPMVMDLEDNEIEREEAV
jgi:hypothetical protein